MAGQAAFSVSLCDYSSTVSKLDSQDASEYAAFGLLVDWELVNFLGKAGYQLCRLSFTWKVDEVLMVVKLMKDDLPYVVFISRSSPTGCIRTLLRKLESDELNLYPDKYG